ncbi:glutamate--tRNA ligase [Thalassobaculum litoreum]|uniref:Glutamate--tRNA ligase n=1 Tax=Thalassobaculum litoreum DSM 18839 TaxID=1123362 RepID=A0A8G2BNR1_9PROT|nr:glutamate--tRNA ligase [Thalassobaculum litoreum]SDG38857.1 glutamyl-tRNA synthetase [Thalassobaculum litoreum DSM 18839]
MSVVTRFAPSPTGFLHIGGARTALFNWLFARHHGGRYLLRIEDTDRKRSTPEAVDAILDGLDWLGLGGDEAPVFQLSRIERHTEVAHKLLEIGQAYRCYCSTEELEQMREKARAEGRQPRYDGTWRDRDPSEAPAGVKPVIRIKAPQDGETTLVDAVQGSVTVPNAQLDDMIILRADGTPTYMHSVVVDDHDMGITHVIRGDDHLNNAFRQAVIYRAMGWDVPVFAHIPLIHGPDGAKLSKRHGALGVDAYRDMGYLPEAVNNYLLRLGWAHGDEEIVPRDKAIELFDLDGVGRSAARFDFAKLENLNGHYIREADNDRLAELVLARLRAEPDGLDLTAETESRIRGGMEGLKARARTIKELADNARFYAATLPLSFDEKANKLLDDDGRRVLSGLAEKLRGLNSFQEGDVEQAVRSFAEAQELKLGKAAQPLRAALTGSTTSPGIFEVLAILGKDESLRRIDAVCGTAH